MVNYGVGFYFKEKNKDCIKAIWSSSQLNSTEIGTGIVKGDTSNGFHGDYLVSYYHPNGNNAGTFDLKIVKSGFKYDLSWSQDGQQKYVGIGIDTPTGMAISYKVVE